jgi:hypothetical protein
MKGNGTCKGGKSKGLDSKRVRAALVEKDSEDGGALSNIKTD